MRYLFRRGRGSRRRVNHLCGYDAMTGEPTMQPLCRIAHQRFDTTTNVPLGRRTCKRCALHAAIAGQMEQARAARAILKDARPPDPYDGKTRRQEQAELDAFMAIFHPGHNRIMLDDEVTE